MVLPLSLGLPPRSHQRRLCAPTVKRGARLPLWGQSRSSSKYNVCLSRLEVDQDRARALGLTPQDVAQILQTLLSGYTVTQYREGIESIDVGARAVPSERLALDRVGELTIRTQNGVAVPLSQIARLDYDYEEPILWRRNRDLVLTARADVVDGVQSPDVSAEIEPLLQSIRMRCLTATASRPAARPRRALRQTRRWRRCFPSWPSPCWRY
jgi:multidrug efflux pump subunit AcrB